MQLEFHYEPGELAQRATLQLASGTQRLEIALEEPGDRLEELAETASDLATTIYVGAPEGHCDERLLWNGEPWQYRWEFIRQNWRDLTINLYFSPDRHVGNNAAHHPLNERQVFACRCETETFVRAIVAELERALLRFGFVRSRESRRYCDFPISGYFHLRAWLHAQETGVVPDGRPHGKSSLAEEIAALQTLLSGSNDRPYPVGRTGPQPVGRWDDGHAEGDLELELRDLEAGWARARIRAGEQEVTFRPGYMTHALEELSSSALQLLQPAGPSGIDTGSEPEFGWEGEPQRLRWEFRRLSPADVVITLRYSPDAYSSDADDPIEEEAVLRTRCSVRHYARQVLEQMEQILTRHGLLGYRESWINAEFPIRDYLVLCCLLADELESADYEVQPWGLADELEILQGLLDRS